MRVNLTRDFFFEGVLYRRAFGGTELPDSIKKGDKEYKLELPPKEKPQLVETEIAGLPKSQWPMLPPEPPEGVIYLPEGTTEVKESKEKAPEPIPTYQNVGAVQPMALSELPKHEQAAYAMSLPPGMTMQSPVPSGPPGSPEESKEDKAQASPTRVSHTGGAASKK